MKKVTIFFFFLSLTGKIYSQNKVYFTADSIYVDVKISVYEFIEEDAYKILDSIIELKKECFNKKYNSTFGVQTMKYCNDSSVDSGVLGIVLHNATLKSMVSLWKNIQGIIIYKSHFFILDDQGLYPYLRKKKEKKHFKYQEKRQLYPSFDEPDIVIYLWYYNNEIIFDEEKSRICGKKGEVSSQKIPIPPGKYSPCR